MKPQNGMSLYCCSGISFEVFRWLFRGKGMALWGGNQISERVVPSIGTPRKHYPNNPKEASLSFNRIIRIICCLNTYLLLLIDDVVTFDITILKIYAYRVRAVRVGFTNLPRHPSLRHPGPVPSYTVYLGIVEPVVLLYSYCKGNNFFCQIQIFCYLFSDS